MRNNLFITSLIIGSLSTIGAACAADQNLEKLSSVQAEIILLKAENEKEDLIQKLKKLREQPVLAEEKASTTPLPVAGPPVPPASAFSMQPSPPPASFGQLTGPTPVPAPKEEKHELRVEERPETPSLRGVVGSGANLFATLAYRSGEEMEATAGDLLPGGFVVTTVTMNKVTLKDKAGRNITVLRSAGSVLKPTAITPAQPEKSYMLSDQPGRGVSILGGPQ